MRYAQLRAFHHVALHGGFSRAAEALNQTQPSLSDQVRRLEQDHDTLLFYREGRRVRLTGAGEDLFLLTRRFFEVEDQIGRHLERSRAAVSGTLRIMADSALHISEALVRFRRRHPGVLVQIASGNSEQVLSALRGYDAEIGILGSLDPAPDLTCVDLGESPIVAIAARGLLPAGTVSLSLDDLRRVPLVFRERGSRTRSGLEEAARRDGIRLSPVIEVEGREAMREVVATGTGVGFISDAELGHDPRIERVPLSGLTLMMTETLVYLTQRRDVPAIRAFMREWDGPAGA
ncbi:LysR family transcriptional regulator [Aliigemmobacter aestuarii]|uniref:LysR family transcriptional regulator n=1 Tax=Aliigemmobacter aestuarii TaxID=1445661 RepID=A0A4S3MJ67_9RHOB|nr:LysR substrate-binding domain-containing protein [Gemmobacter aestuarii]THD81171.1 LysR family transcriptional regulator [Gemmobacter aestuarii]